MANWEKKAERLELRLSLTELGCIRIAAASGRGCSVSEFVREAAVTRARAVESKRRQRRRGRVRAHGVAAAPK